MKNAITLTWAQNTHGMAGGTRVRSGMLRNYLRWNFIQHKSQLSLPRSQFKTVARVAIISLMSLAARASLWWAPRCMVGMLIAWISNRAGLIPWLNGGANIQDATPRSKATAELSMKSLMPRIEINIGCATIFKSSFRDAYLANWRCVQGD